MFRLNSAVLPEVDSTFFFIIHLNDCYDTSEAKNTSKYFNSIRSSNQCKKTKLLNASPIK